MTEETFNQYWERKHLADKYRREINGIDLALNSDSYFCKIEIYRGNLTYDNTIYVSSETGVVDEVLRKYKEHLEAEVKKLEEEMLAL